MLADTLDEPLVLADGTKINPSNGTVVRDKRKGFIEVPSHSKAQAIIASTRRTVADLPMPPDSLSGVAIVAFYALYGFSNQEIAIALNGKLSLDQIGRIQELEAYKDFMDAAKENILNTEQEAVRDVFAKNAAGAAHRVVELAESDNDVLAFKASQDILDRAGHRPVDTVNHNLKFADALNIVIVKKDSAQDIPMINITPERLFDDNNDTDS